MDKTAHPVTDAVTMSGIRRYKITLAVSTIVLVAFSVIGSVVES